MVSISCYLFDYASRKYFYSNHLLIMESRKTEDLNLHLEDQVQQRTASLEEANRELVAANEIAEESGKMKSVFLATMSHELRTPLTAIIGFSEIVLSGENDKEEIQSISKIINNSGHHLLSLVESLLDITLIEAGQVHLRMGEVRLVELLADVNSIIRQEQTKLEKQDIKISIDTKTFKSDYLVITDGFKVKQILINLLKNSLKFTENGEIVFGCEEIIQRGDKYLKFHVIDTGIGIADDKKEFIFDVFRQIDDTHSRKYGGVGIGLTVVHKLTHLLGGKVWVDSVVGKGSSFYFTIRNYENLESEIFDVEDYV